MGRGSRPYSRSDTHTRTHYFIQLIVFDGYLALFCDSVLYCFSSLHLFIDVFLVLLDISISIV